MPPLPIASGCPPPPCPVTAGAGRGHLAEVCVRLLLAQPFHTILSEGQPTEGEGRLLHLPDGQGLHHLCGTLHRGVCPRHTQSFVSNCMDSYAFMLPSGHHPIPLYLSALVPRSNFRRLLGPSGTPSPGFLRSTSLGLGTTRRSPWTLPAQVLGSPALLPFLGDGVRNQDLGTTCAQCCWVLLF